MPEEDITIPKLTLTPDLSTDGKDGDMPQNILLLEKKEEAVRVEELENLTPAEMKMVEDFAKQIDLTNSNIVLTYGASAQKNVADFSDAALKNIRTKDAGEVGEMLGNLVIEIKSFNADTTTEEKGVKGWFKNTKKQIDKVKVSYTQVEANIDTITGELKKHQTVLLKDIAMLDKMYDMNRGYFKELTLYIAAGEKKLQEVRNVTVPELRDKAARTGDTLDAQLVNDTISMADRFEKKLHDLRLTKQVSLQMAPQIRMIQNNNTILVEKIQSSIVNTIPLWKNQVILSLGLQHSQKAIQAQREVTDLTNEMLKKNAEALKIGTIEAAKESERGIIDIETLKQTNQSLISTFDEVLKISEEGRAKRIQAEIELKQLEGELKTKLLSVAKR